MMRLLRNRQRSHPEKLHGSDLGQEGQGYRDCVQSIRWRLFGFELGCRLKVRAIEDAPGAGWSLFGASCGVKFVSSADRPETVACTEPYPPVSLTGFIDSDVYVRFNARSGWPIAAIKP
jgi:hypothetical protein